MSLSKANLYLINTECSTLLFSDVKRLYPGLAKILKKGDMLEDISFHDPHILSYNPGGIYFYDGKGELETPDFKSNRHACVPSTFEAITEFHPRYWSSGNARRYQEVNVINIYEKGSQHKFYWHDCEDPYVALSVKKLNLLNLPIRKHEGAHSIFIEHENGKYLILMPTHLDHKFPEDILWVIPAMSFLPMMNGDINVNHTDLHEIADEDNIPYENMLWVWI